MLVSVVMVSVLLMVMMDMLRLDWQTITGYEGGTDWYLTVGDVFIMVLVTKIMV